MQAHSQPRRLKLPSSPLRFVVVGVCVFEILLNFGRLFRDSTTWIIFAKVLVGPDPVRLIGLIDPAVRLRFMLPLLVAPLVLVIDPRWSYAAANAILWLAGLVLIYRTSRFLADERIGGIAGVLYSASVSMVAYGASVLTDPAGYFFVGLALYSLLGLSKTLPARHTHLLVGILLTVGGFFHPVGFVGLLYVLVGLLLMRKLSASFLVGIGLVVLLVLPLVAFLGANDLLNVVARVNPSARGLTLFSLLMERQGGPVIDVMEWTYGITGPLDYIANLFHGPEGFVAACRFLVFLAILIVGIKELKEKKILLGYVPFLSFYLIFVARINIERYFFVLWPIVIFSQAMGIFVIARVLTSVIRRRLSYSGGAFYSALTNPSLYALVYVLAQGLLNSIHLLRQFGIPWLVQ